MVIPSNLVVTGTVLYTFKNFVRISLFKLGSFSQTKMFLLVQTFQLYAVKVQTIVNISHIVE